MSAPSRKHGPRWRYRAAVRKFRQGTGMPQQWGVVRRGAGVIRRGSRWVECHPHACALDINDPGLCSSIAPEKSISVRRLGWKFSSPPPDRNVALVLMIVPPNPATLSPLRCPSSFPSPVPIRSFFITFYGGLPYSSTQARAIVSLNFRPTPTSVQLVQLPSNFSQVHLLRVAPPRAPAP